MKFKVKYILDFPKTIYFNFKMFPFKEAIRFPVYVSHNYKLDLPRHTKNISIDNLKTFCIRFGNGGSMDIIPNQYGLIQLGTEAKLHFYGDAQFAAGCSLRVDCGKMEFGNNFSANRNCNITCTKGIKIGDNCLLGGGISLRDNDGHKLYIHETQKTGQKEIVIGKQVWICSEVKILKGVVISDYSVIAMGSLVTRKFFETNVLIGGNPAKVIEHGIWWEK